MRAGRAGGVAGVLALGLVLGARAPAAELPGEVRVLSGPGPATTVAIRVRPEVEIEDRTPGAKPAAGARGPASSGETFTGELTLFLRQVSVPRSAAIDVGDPLVSVVRLFPEPEGTTVSVFVRQPVTYTVSRPSATGEVQVELHGKTRPLTVTGVSPRGRPHVVAPKRTGEQEVAVDAESLSYDQPTNTLTARGGVTLTRGDTTLTADEVVYDRTNAVAEARGNVVLTDPHATVEGDFAHLNLEDETGWVESANAKLRPSDYTLRAGRIDKHGGPRYSVANGVFTTCECGGLERPSWSIAGRQTDITLQGTGVVHGATLRVKDVPVLYVPWALFPANTERQSGFLFPRIGYSNRRGFQYEQPFFWAINKSSDATVALDIETAARIGILGEYRYLLSRDTRGEFTVAYYNEQIRGRTLGTVTSTGGPADVPENRFAMAGHHIQPFYGDSRFYLNLFALSDDFVLRDMNSFSFAGRTDLSLRSTRYTTSRTGVFKEWDGGVANIEAAYHQDLIDPQELALQRLPSLEAEHSLPLLGDRLVGRLTGQAVDYQREQGYDGLRADLAPELFLPFHLGHALAGSLTGRLRETAYHLTDTQQVAFIPTLPARFRTAPELPRLEENRTRELAEVVGRSGTSFERVFDFRHLGLEKLRHTIEPEVQYLFVPQVSRPIFDVPAPSCAALKRQGIPQRPGDNCDATLFSEGFLFDERDAINHRNFFSYGITTRLLGRAASPAEAAAHEAEAETREAPPRAPVDLETLPQGLSAEATPPFVGPPAPPATAAGGPTPGARELARASVLHGYDLSRDLVGTSHQSDVDFGLRLTPVDYLGFTYNATVSLEQQSLRGLAVGVFGREPGWRPPSLVRNYQGATTVGLSYRFIDENVNQETATPGSRETALLQSPGVNELDGSLYIRLGSYLGFTFLSRYDLNTTGTGATAIGPHFLERDYLFRIISRCNCWVLDAGVSDKFNPDERLFRVQFTLIGLGSVGRIPTTNYVGPLSQIGFRRPGVGPAGGY